MIERYSMFQLYFSYNSVECLRWARYWHQDHIRMKKGKNNKGRPKKVTSILGTDREQNYRIWSIKEIMKNWFIFKISVQFHFTFMYFSIDVHLKSKIQHQQRASIIQVSSAPPIKLINVHLIFIFLHTPPPPIGNSLNIIIPLCYI